MKVTRRSAHPVSKTKAPKKAAAAQKQKKAAPETTFNKQGTQHAKKLDPAPATHTVVPQRDVHADPTTRLKAAVAEGHLTRLDHAPRGVEGKVGWDIGSDEKGWYAGALTERTAFEQGGKVYVHATEWETPGKVWFELGPKPVAPPPKPDRAAPMRARVDAGVLQRLDHPPRGLDDSKGIDIGGDGQGWYAGAKTERTAFEHGGKVYVKATVWETPGKVWFELAAKPAPVAPKPDPAVALKVRIEASTLVPIKAPPKGLSGQGVEIGGDGRQISQRRVYEHGDQTFMRATIWERPPQWYEVK